jgi:hypothetical protein
MKQPDLITPAIENYEKTQSLNTFIDEMRGFIYSSDESSSEEEQMDEANKKAELVL